VRGKFRRARGGPGAFANVLVQEPLDFGPETEVQKQHPRKAADCIGLRKQIAEECAALYPDLCSFEYIECVEERERTEVGACLDRVKNAAGSGAARSRPLGAAPSPSPLRLRSSL
jgi:hypothetical protein